MHDSSMCIDLDWTKTYFVYMKVKVKCKHNSYIDFKRQAAQLLIDYAH